MGSNASPSPRWVKGSRCAMPASASRSWSWGASAGRRPPPRSAPAREPRRSAGSDPGLVPVAGTGGLLADAAPFADAIRPGLGLYGMLPAWAASSDHGLRPILSLRALPLRIYDLPVGGGR